MSLFVANEQHPIRININLNSGGSIQFVFLSTPPDIVQTRVHIQSEEFLGQLDSPVAVSTVKDTQPTSVGRPLLWCLPNLDRPAEQRCRFLPQKALSSVTS